MLMDVLKVLKHILTVEGSGDPCRRYLGMG